MALRPFFSVWQALSVQNFLLKSAPFSKLFADLGSTNKIASSFSSLTLALFLLHFLFLHPFYLALLRHIWWELSSFCFAIRLQWVAGYSFLSGNELAKRDALLQPFTVPCSLFSRVHSSLGLEAYCVKVFTQVPQYSLTEELLLPRHACCVVSSLRCNEHSLLPNSYIFRIESLSCVAGDHPTRDTSRFILLRTLRRSHFGDCFLILWSKPLEVVLLPGLHGLPPCLHFSERVR